MKYWFDTEFIEDGKTIDLLSIGIVSEDGREYYAEPEETDRSRADEWITKNVIPYLTGPIKHRKVIAEELKEFIGVPDTSSEDEAMILNLRDKITLYDTPEFWAHYCATDWVGFYQLFGRLIDLPNGWPMFCRDTRQLQEFKGNPKIPKLNNYCKHNALADAKECRDMYYFLKGL